MSPKWIGEINRPILEPMNLIGKVMQHWGPWRIDPMPKYRCNKCEEIYKVIAKFPYDRISFPTYCKCGSYKSQSRFEMIPCNLQESRVKYKVHLRDGTTDFILILLDNENPPNPGQVISFSSRAIPKIKGKSPLIRLWTGEAMKFSTLISEQSSEVCA